MINTYRVQANYSYQWFIDRLENATSNAMQGYRMVR